MKLWVDAREIFGDGGFFYQIGGLQLGEKLIHGRAERLAEFDEAIEAGQDAGSFGHGVGNFARGEIQAAQRIDEESGASAHFIAQQRYAGAGGVESFDDYIFEFVAEELLDGAFEFFFDFGVIGEQAYGAESF